MLDKYEEQLSKLKQSVDNLGAKIIESIDTCKEGLTTLDTEKFDACRNVLVKTENDANAIDQSIVRILALYEPEAVELRELVAYLKITGELVRVCDNINSFAKRMKAHISSEMDYTEIQEYSTHLVTCSFKAIAFAIEAISITNEEDAKDLFRKASVEESKSDDLYSVLEKNIMSNLCKDVHKSADLIEVLSTMRKLERMADRAVNIAKLMLFARVGGELKQF